MHKIVTGYSLHGLATRLGGMTNSNPYSAESSNLPQGRYPSLVLFIVICFSVAGSGAFFPPDDWYRSLTKPSFAPPDWLFGPVWTILYTMIAVAGWSCWNATSDSSKRLAFFAFGIQLLLNATWSGLFFGLHQSGWALVEIVVLWIAILSTIVLFRRHSLLAAVLLIPYLAWVSFAAVLNYGFWSLN